MSEMIRATYAIVSSDLPRAAALIAREMSVGVKKTRYENIKTGGFMATVDTIKKAGSRGIITIDVPSANISTIYGLLLSIAGEISCLKILKSIELLDFEVSPALADRLPGPAFGLAGIKKRRGNVDRPLFITVIKPSQGLTPEEYAHIAYESLVGGMDAIKSDELLQESDKDWSARFEAAVAAARRAEKETGEPKSVMMHPVDSPIKMASRFSRGADMGCDLAMLSPAASGFPMLEELARMERFPIMAHMAMSGWLWQKNGMSVRAWSKFMRLAGADIVLYPALKGTLKATRPELSEVMDAASTPMGTRKESMIAVGGGMHAGTMKVHYDLFGPDFAYLCGGGVCGHPDGARAGGKSIRQAWDAISRGIPLSRHRKSHPELDAALTAFSRYV
jgi:ribulose-bisphosphate carboxylase large chain